MDFAGNKIALNYSKIIDGHTLEILTYASNEEIKNHKIPTIAKVFSPDGKYLYLLGFEGKEKSLILDARTGKALGRFEGGTNDIAVSPDGSQLAMGNKDNQSVKISVLNKASGQVSSWLMLDKKTGFPRHSPGYDAG